MPFLNNILALLRRAGLIDGRRGVGGGWRLSRAATEISIADVLAAISGPSLAQMEVAREGARNAVGLAVDAVWSSLRSSVESLAAATTVFDLMSAAGAEQRQS